MGSIAESSPSRIATVIATSIGAVSYLAFMIGCTQAEWRVFVPSGAILMTCLGRGIMRDHPGGFARWIRSRRPPWGLAGRIRSSLPHVLACLVWAGAAIISVLMGLVLLVSVLTIYGYSPLDWVIGGALCVGTFSALVSGLVSIRPWRRSKINIPVLAWTVAGTLVMLLAADSWWLHCQEKSLSIALSLREEREGGVDLSKADVMFIDDRLRCQDMRANIRPLDPARVLLGKKPPGK